jgi:ABC-type branched-subunit amino acid transport system substrate-binding protein
MSIRRLRARTGIAAVAAVLVALPAALTACGKASTTTADGANTCGTQVPGVTGSSVKIGLVYPDSGPAQIAATFLPAREGVEARLAQQNARGGVNGRKVDMVWGDDQSDTSTFSQVAHDLVDTQQVFGLIATSVAFDGSADWLLKEDVPVTGTATSAKWSDYANVFHSGNLFNTGGTSLWGDYVRHQGGTRALVIIDPSVAASQSLAMQFAPSLQSRGVSIVGEVTYTPGVTNVAHVAEQFRSLGADTLVGAFQPGSFTDIYARVKALGARINVALNATGFSPGLLAQRGADMAGMSVMSRIAAQGTPAMTTYLDAMHTYAPELADPTDELAFAGYAAADEMIEGLQRAGACPTRQAFIQNLRKVTDYTVGGLISPIDLTKPKQPTLCGTFIKVDSAGSSFAPVPPPAALDQDGYWCGTALQ